MIVEIIDGDEVISADVTKEEEVKIIEDIISKIKEEKRIIDKVVLEFKGDATVDNVNDIFSGGDGDGLVAKQIMYLKKL